MISNTEHKNDNEESDEYSKYNSQLFIIYFYQIINF